MNHEMILRKVSLGELSALDAYDIVSTAVDTKKLRRAFFVKMRISLPNESLRLNIFLKLLFGLPIPVGIVRFFFTLGMKHSTKLKGKVLDDLDLDINALSELLKYSRGTTIKVESNDTIVSIKIR